MRSPEYLLLEKMLEKNRRLYKQNSIEFEEYIENHALIMDRLNRSLFRMESTDFNYLTAIDVDDCLDRFRKGIFIVQYNLN